MSIDSYIWVPAGTRDHNSIGYRRYKSWEAMLVAESPIATSHQVFLAQQHLIDEQYFFEDVKDARWFWSEGYKERLLLESGGETPMSYDRMALWIQGELVEERTIEPILAVNE